MRLFSIYGLLMLLSVATASKKIAASVYKVGSEYKIKYEKDLNAIAFGYFDEAIHETGWNFLSIRTNEKYSNHEQSYAAGYLEGVLTAKQIYIQLKVNYPDPAPPKKVQKFLDENAIWAEEQKKSGEYADYWDQRENLDIQVDAIYDGYMSVATGRMLNVTKYQFIVANYEFDIGDLCAILPDEGNVCYNEPVFKNRCHSGKRVDRCSALLKVLPNNEDILMSHVTWGHAQDMYRIYKIYDMNLHLLDGELIPGHKVVVPGVPGRFTSGDDFYMTSARLAIQETTIEVWDQELNKLVTPKSDYQWARSALACRLARNAGDWIDVYALYNNGLYNNQWMVLDYNLFKPFQPIQDGTFLVYEQIPGRGHAADMSYYLREKTYWSSFNVPFFKDIFNKCGYPAKVKEWGPKAADWFMSARGQIFRRDQHKVHDLASMARMMRYNDFQHDPICSCNCTPPYTSQYAISSRSDLNKKDGIYPFEMLGFRDHMGYDTKITSMKLLDDHLGAAIISGPTYDQQPVFEWATSDIGPLDHEDYPDKFDFPFYIARMDIDGEDDFDYTPFYHLKYYVC